MRFRKLTVFFVLVIAVVTAVAFYPSLSNDFVNWDDPCYVINNPVIKELSIENFKKMFVTGFLKYFCPLTMLSYAIEYHFFELNPFIYHLTNYVLHILITLLVFYFIYMITDNIIIAFITAGLFGIHPLHVESVAWVTERKDVLCAVFYMLSLIFYIKHIRREAGNYYIASFICLVFALSAKPLAITLPLVILLLDYFFKQKVILKTIFEKVPFFIISLIFGIIGLIYHWELSVKVMSKTNKIYFISKAIPFYLSKIIMPVNLSAMYPHHEVMSDQLSEIKYYIAIMVVLVLFIILSKKYSRKIIFGSMFFLITVLPALPVSPVIEIFAADRYMYLPSIGIFYIFSIFYYKLFFSNRVRQRIVNTFGIICLCAIFSILSFLTWKRCYVWKDSLTFYEAAVKSAPNSVKMHYNMAVTYLRLDRKEEAIEMLKKTIKIDPEYSRAYYVLAGTYKKLGMNHEAKQSYQQFIAVSKE